MIWLAGAIATFIMIATKAYANHGIIKQKIQEIQTSAEADMPDEAKGFPVAAAISLIITFLFAASVVLWPLYLYKVITKKAKNDN